MKKKKSEKLASILRSSSIKDAAEILVNTIGDVQYPPDNIEEDINVLRIMERVFSAKHKGSDLNLRDIKNWSALFDRCEKIFKLSESGLSFYAQVVLRETIGHRYSDFYKLRKKKEDKFNESYQIAFDISNEQNFYAHKDASSFWNGYAYLRCGKIAKSAPFFARVINNRLSFKQVRMHRLKVEASFDFFVKYPEYTPENIKEGTSALVKQDERSKEMFDVSTGIPDNKMDCYKQRWL